MYKKKSIFITFEGIEGSGKSYQSKKLYNKLKKKKVRTLLTREPGGTKSAELIRNLILKDYFSKGCIDCGEKDIRVLEFDHVRGVKKRFKHRRGEGVSFLLMNGYNWEAIKKEIDKCEVRCCNCHKLRTYEQFNYLRDMKDITEEYFNKLEQSKK